MAHRHVELERHWRLNTCSGIVSRRAVDGRNLPAHRPDVRAELATVVDGVEQPQPAEAARRLADGVFAVYIEWRFLFPCGVAQLAEFFRNHFGGALELAHHFAELL